MTTKFKGTLLGSALNGFLERGRERFGSTCEFSLRTEIARPMLTYLSVSQSTDKKPQTVKHDLLREASIGML